MDTYEVEVAKTLDETPRDRTLLLALVEEAPAFAHRPGQYVLVTDPATPDGPPCGFTISSAPRDDGSFEITVRNAGRCGNQIHSYEAGKRLRVTAPAGNFVLDVDTGKHLLMIAAGSGVTPFRAYLQHLASIGNETPCCLLQCARSPGDLLFRSEFESLAQSHAWFRHVPSATTADDDGWAGARGRFDESTLRANMPEPERTIVYACGPNAFVDDMLACAASLGVAEHSRRRESWG